ncbi:MAG: hypothetical protein RIK87_22530 [Fuerstiella sp.]
MNFSSEQIERITQSVLRELVSRGVVVAAPRPAESRTSSVRPPQGSGQPGQPDRTEQKTQNGVRLNAQVITEELLAGVQAAGRTISLSPGAIITPSGHDFIRRHGVTVSRNGTAAATPTTGVLFVVGECESAISAATTAGWVVKRTGCEFDAARQAMSLNGTKPAVCCGGEASVTACLLNRNVSVRAAVVTPTTNVERLVRHMNPQIVCLNAGGWSFVDMTRLLRQLAVATTATPQGWREFAGGAE